MRRIIALVAAFNPAGELLLLKRPQCVHRGGFWSFPGGKVEAGETPLAAARRELIEETALTGRRWRFLARAHESEHGGGRSFHLFCCFVAHPETLRPEAPHAWVRPEMLGRYPMPPVNARLLPSLRIPELEAWLAKARIR